MPILPDQSESFSSQPIEVLYPEQNPVGNVQAVLLMFELERLGKVADG